MRSLPVERPGIKCLEGLKIVCDAVTFCGKIRFEVLGGGDGLGARVSRREREKKCREKRGCEEDNGSPMHITAHCTAQSEGITPRE